MHARFHLPVPVQPDTDLLEKKVTPDQYCTADWPELDVLSCAPIFTTDQFRDLFKYIYIYRFTAFRFS